MTKGNSLKLIVRFLLPVVVGNVFQQLYNVADSIIVGRNVGADALAAVGATGTIMFLILGFMSGLTSGFAVVTAQRFGAGDEEGVRHSVCSAIVLSVLTTAVMTAISLIGMRGLLRLMNTPDDVFDMSYTYIFTICAGMFCTVLYNLTSALLRAVGNSKAPLYFLVAAAFFNIGLDLLFIISFRMGVFGAALATVISQGLSGLCCLIYIFIKCPVLSPALQDWKNCKKHMKQQMQIGLPMAFQFSITALGTIIVQSALNTLGSTVMAAYTASNKIDNILTTPFLAMGVAMATYCGQNRGINDYKRIRKGTRDGSIITILYAVVIGAVAMFTTDFTIPLFVDGDASAILEPAKVYFSICPKYYIPLGLIFVFRNALQGMGYSVTTLLGSFIELASRIVLAIFAIKNASFRGVCYANAAAWLSAGILLFVCFEVVIMKQLRNRTE